MTTEAAKRERRTEPIMTNVSLKIKNRPPLTSAEFQGMLSETQKITQDFRRFRNTAVLCLGRMTGKRREEIGAVEFEKTIVTDKSVLVTFMLEKKKRQFKICSKCKVRNSAKASFCRDCGADLTKEKIQKRGKTTEATKELPVADPLTKYIIAYITFLKSLQSKPVFLFPPVVPIFGGEEIVCFDRHITGRTVFNIIKTVNPRAWAHLFRETAAADVIKQDDSLTAVFKVQRRLDLESYEVAFNYLRRFSADKIERESLQKNG